MRDAWVFDVDGCLVDEITGSTLRPLATDVFEALERTGVDIVVWSAGGADYARRRLAQFGLEDRVASFHGKLVRTSGGHWSTVEISARRRPRLFVDDRPGDLAPDVPVLAVPPYLGGSRHDRGLRAVLEAAQASAQPVSPDRGGCCPR